MHRWDKSVQRTINPYTPLFGVDLREGFPFQLSENVRQFGLAIALILNYLFPSLPVYTVMASPEQFVRPQRL